MADMASDPTPESWVITSEKAAKLLGYTNTTSFLRAVRNNGIPYIRFSGRRIMFDPEALRKWLDSRTIGRRDYR